MTKLRSRRDLVLVPTDKTNGVKLMEKALHSTLFHMHLASDSKLTDLSFVKKVKKDAEDHLKSIESILLDQEYNYIKSIITKCAVLTIQLLVKDYKTVTDKNGNHKTATTTKWQPTN